MVRVNLAKPKGFVRPSSSRASRWIAPRKGPWIHVVVTGFVTTPACPDAQAVTYASKW